MIKKICFFNNNFLGMVYFRLEVIQRFLDKGYAVSIIAPEGGNMEALKKLPKEVKRIPVKMNRTSTNPIKDVVLMCQLIKVLRAEKPIYLFNYTIKPNVYGALAAKLLGIRCTDMIAGLGYTFTNNSLSSRIARTLYKVAGKCAEKIVVLNKDNYEAVLKAGICKEDKLHLLTGGEGVDLKRYPYYQNGSEDYKFIYIGRLIEEKGYNEFAAAAKRVLAKHQNVEFHVIGGFDLGYPRCVTKEQVERDSQEKGIIYDGSISDMSKIYSQKGVVIVIPSYYSEGLNRSLMEGCSSGKPIITTDWPGCRETVRDGVNGYLVKPRNVESLVTAIEKYIGLSADEKENFSIASRKLAEQEFNVGSVVSYYESLADATVVGGAVLQFRNKEFELGVEFARCRISTFEERRMAA